MQEATENDKELAELRCKCRNIVTYFKQSIKATDNWDKLTEVQKQIGGKQKQLIRDVITKQNSSFYMYERLIQEGQAVNITLVSVKSYPFSSVASVSSHGTLKQELLKRMAKRFIDLKSNYSLAVSMLLGPKFKKIGFGDTSACNQVV